LKVPDADRFPQIRFQASEIDKVGDGYRLTGTLEIHGVANERGIDVRGGSRRRMAIVVPGRRPPCC
jgi:polyisoprenoid-binding protein YceI